MFRATFVSLALLSVAALGCGKKDGGGSAESCGPLEVTVDGKPIEGLTVGKAYKESTGGYLVYVFNHDKATCEQMLAGQRTVPDGEVAVRAYAKPGGGMMNSVGLGVHTQMGIKVSVATEPKKEGDTVALCVGEKAEFTPKIGDYKEKKVAVKGLLSGSYCGEQK